MTDLDKSFASNGGDANQRSEVLAGGRSSMPFFPSPPGQPGTPPHGTPVPGTPVTATPVPGPLAAPTMAPPPPLVPSQVQGRHTQPGHQPGQPDSPGTEAVVKGRITIEDEVVEKIAALAVLEVYGVAALSVHAERPAGREGGVRVLIHDNEASLDLAIVVEYGTVIMDVAKVVKTNVARVVSLMLGMRVTAVNVIVDDVRMPGK